MKVDRLVSIILLLLEKERIGAQELADQFEVSPRTIYRDIDAISMAGIPVRAVPGVGGGFEIMPEYKLDQTVFSSADLSAILMGLSSLSNMIRGDELVNALAKVKSFIPAESAKDIELKANQIYIDLSPRTGNSSIQPYLEMIKTALQERKLLIFDYTAHHGNQTVRTVEPYQLVLKSSHWYLQGYCHIRSDFRLFRLSRMSNLRMQEEPFVPRDFQKPQLNVSDTASAMQTTIKIRIHKSVMDRVLDYCAFERFSADGDEHYIVRFPFIENEFYYGILWYSLEPWRAMRMFGAAAYPRGDEAQHTKYCRLIRLGLFRLSLICEMAPWILKPDLSFDIWHADASRYAENPDTTFDAGSHRW